HLLGPWLVAIIACSLALGFDGVVMTLLTTGIVVEVFMRGTFSAPYILIGTFVTLGGSSGGSLWLIIVRRRQWRMAAPNVQWARAAAVAVAVFIIRALGGLTLLLVL